MGECICSSCRNLKGVMEESGAVETYECEFGFPSEACSECETGVCEYTCSHYLSDEEETQPVVLRCSDCGRELLQVCSNEEKGKVQCMDCWLRTNGGGEKQ